ncbi:hypothetical protein [Klebsiella pneumoniae]|uniref:hypothetical protein n=1 Tax=Klebsiella pneumoniae TaxID=573 RepID=UPI00226F71D4|nr:hypothetical protein [Klebsiella pneumoniae]MCY0160095.1 hypothetical protein [Klebsiella pneumoniae]
MHRTSQSDPEGNAWCDQDFSRNANMAVRDHQAAAAAKGRRSAQMAVFADTGD